MKKYKIQGDLCPIFVWCGLWWGGLGIFNVLTLIQGDISYEFRGQSYDIFITENSKFWETSISLLKVNLGDIYISLKLNLGDI